MTRPTGLLDRRGYTIDAATVVVGAVAAGTRGRAAETRTGAARLLNTRLEALDVFKVIVRGSTGSAGLYTLQAAHVAEGAALASATGWATIATITLAPGIDEIPLTGRQVRAWVAAAGSLTGDVRVVAVRANAGTAGDAPAGTNMISFDVARF